MSRKVLSKMLSANSELLLSELEQSFQKPIIFYSIDELGWAEDSKDAPFGAINNFSSEPYKVFLKEDLSNDDFETNLFHELRHIWQMESAFPAIDTKSKYKYDEDQLNEIYIKACIKLQSLILDVDVHNWLKSKGYSSNFFVNSRFETLMHDKYYKQFLHNKDLEYHNSNLISINLIIDLIEFFTFSNENQKHQIKKEYGANPNLKLAEELAQMVCEINPITPQTIMLCMGLLLDKLDLWDFFYIRFNNQKIRNAKEFELIRNE